MFSFKSLQLYLQHTNDDKLHIVKSSTVYCTVLHCTVLYQNIQTRLKSHDGLSHGGMYCTACNAIASQITVQQFTLTHCYGKQYFTILYTKHPTQLLHIALPHVFTTSRRSGRLANLLQPSEHTTN